MGTLQVQQGVVPLNLARDIDRLGEARPAAARGASPSRRSTLGSVNQTTRPVRDQFAPGQLFDLTDDERLAAPSFDEMDAGVAFGDDTYTFAASAVVRSPFDYTDITIGPDGTPTVEPEPVPTDGTTGARARRSRCRSAGVVPRAGEALPLAALAGGAGDAAARLRRRQRRRRRRPGDARADDDVGRGPPRPRRRQGSAPEPCSSCPPPSRGRAPMSDRPANLVLLPWLRRGGTAALAQPDSLGADQPGVATAKAALAVNDAPPIPMDVRLMGPGHVTGLQAGQVIRTDPTPGSRAFEPNYCPLVEFDEPSLPWLFTPGRRQRRAATATVAVPRRRAQAAGVQLSPPRRGALPVLTIGSPADPNAELPDLARAGRGRTRRSPASCRRAARAVRPSRPSAR